MGAIHIRSDVERKRLAGIGALGSSASGADQGLYAPDVNDRTYERLKRCADDVLAGGYCVIVDATFQRRVDRDRFSARSSALGIPLVLIQCRASLEVLQARILQRQRSGDDASEANMEILERQQARFEPIDPGEALTVIEADTAAEAVVQNTLMALESVGVQRSSRRS
jgi:predicted kinase